MSLLGLARAIFRFLSRYVFSQTATMEQYLADVQKHLSAR